MADKKVDRSRTRPLTPTQKMTASLSDSGTMDMADATHDKGRSALVDKFRDREERWRREQTARDREALQEQGETVQQETGEAGEAGTAEIEAEAEAETEGEVGGGAS